MTVREMQDEILRLKKEKDICILAHTYQSQAVLEVADFTGDSYGLSVKASEVPQKGVILCGCPLYGRDMQNPESGKESLAFQFFSRMSDGGADGRGNAAGAEKQYPDYTVVAYINTSAELKTECDVCVTSSSAVSICAALENG